MKKAKEKKENKSHSLWHRFLSWWKTYFKTLADVIRGTLNDNVGILASGLVYSTLIALVPMITFLFVFLSSFGVLQTFLDLLQEWLMHTFGVDTAVQIIEQVSKYSSNAMSLGVFGFVSFLITGMFLVNKIYLVINQIFRTKFLTNFIKRLFIFLVTLIVLSFLIALAFALQNTLTLRLQAKIDNVQFTGGLIETIKQLGAYAIVWLIFFLILMFVPNTKVRPISATYGATTGLIAFFIVNTIFSWVISQMVNYWTIYGTLASLLFILLYFYILWYIVIVISEITYIHQFKPDRNTLLGRPQHPVRIIGEAMNMLLYIGVKFAEGKGTSSLREMAKDLSISPSRLNVYMQDYIAGSILLPTNTQRTSVILARPADQIQLKDIIEILYGKEYLSEKELRSIGDEIAKDFFYRGVMSFEGMTLNDLIKESLEHSKEKKND